MKTLNTAAILCSFAIAFSASASSGAISNEKYKSEKDRISADYKTGKEMCDKLAGNPRDICLADVKGRKNIAETALDAQRNPGPKANYEVLITKAEADYSVAKEQCNAREGDAKDQCQKAARQAFDSAKADAKVELSHEND
ncbi:MAG: hypothetical protein IT488_04715 [Gammaproteobacteria bacterium]|nr:hypothetical protein [Gammaproteobacteria bacterium]